MKRKLDQKDKLMEDETKEVASKSMAPWITDDNDGIPSLLAGRPKSGMQAGLQGRLPVKGKIAKGTPFDFRNSNIESKSKVAELEA